MARTGMCVMTLMIGTDNLENNGGMANESRANIGGYIFVK